MIALHETEITQDVENKRVVVERSFDAPVDQVWSAWTNHELLDQWWAPKPWKARTKKMDFREGGLWLYCMVGPDGEASWARVDFRQIDPLKSFFADDSFCDEDGNLNQDLPGMHWKSFFTSTASGSKIRVELTFASVEDLHKMVEMGFKEGFTSALGNLDELLANKQ